MSKKIRTGLKGLRVAPLIDDLSASMSEDGIAKVTYGEIVKLKDVQNVDLTMRTQTAEVDADDESDTLMQCTGCDGKTQRTMFSPKELAVLLDETILEDGSVVSSSDDEPGEFATGFYCKINGGTYLAMWLFRTKYSTGDMSAETAGNEKLNPQSDTLSFKSMKRKSDGMWRIYKEVDTEEEALAFLTSEKLNQIYKKEKKDETSSAGSNENAGSETSKEKAE